jgi:hypothetical protein
MPVVFQVWMSWIKPPAIDPVKLFPASLVIGVMSFAGRNRT